LKGASPEYEGAPVADRWALDDELAALAIRWQIEPGSDLVKLDDEQRPAAGESAAATGAGSEREHAAGNR